VTASQREAPALSILAPVLPRPFPRDHLHAMTDHDWSRIPAVQLHAQELIPSQEGVSLQRISELLAGGAPEGGDWCGRAVLWEGRVYVFDGHHRWLLACLRGEPFWARLVDVHGCVPDAWGER
jgi:hypothetical protein